MARSRQCERGREWVSRRLDGELSELESRMLARHLVGCAGCMRFEADVSAFTARLRVAPHEPRELSVELHIGRRSRKRPATVRIASAAAAVAVAAAVALAIDLGVRPQSASLAAGRAGDAGDSLVMLRSARRAELQLPHSPLANARVRVIELG